MKHVDFQLTFSWGGGGILLNPQKIIIEDYKRIQYQTQIQVLLDRKSPPPKFEGPIYTGTTCEIPRYKIKAFLEESGLKRTNCFDYASTIVFNKNFLHDLLQRLKNSARNKGTLFVVSRSKKLYEYLRDLNHTNWAKGQFDKQYEECGENINIFVSNDIIKDIKSITNYGYNPIIDGNFVSDHKDILAIDIYRGNKLVGLLEMIDFVLNNPKVNILFDDEFINSLNSDGINLEGDYLETVQQMLKSNDKDNIRMALDMLSNVDLENNIVEMALLLNSNRSLFYHGSGFNPSSHSGFKLLKNYFENKKIMWNQGWKKFISSLIKTNPEKKELIKGYIIENLNSDLVQYNQAPFEITDVKFKG